MPFDIINYGITKKLIANVAADVADVASDVATNTSQLAATYTKTNSDTLFVSMLTKENYHAVMKAWFSANGAAAASDLTELVERWYSITRTGWTGGTRFYNTDQSQLSTGTKVGDNAGLTCTPSTIAAHNTDNYEGLPLFAVIDCNWWLDAAGKRHIRAIDGVEGYNAFTRTDAAYPVGVLQMAPWIKQTQESTAYTEWMTDQAHADGYIPVPEAVDLDGTVHSWVVHAKYGMGDAYSSISGAPIRAWDVSHNSQITAIRAAFNNRYCGKCSCDDAWMKLHVHIKYASLTLDNIMNGCCSYYNSTLQPAVAETGVKRVLITTAQGAGLVAGSTVCLGSATYGSKSTQCSVVDRARITSIETVEVGGTSYSAINLDVASPFDTTTALYLTTMHWHAGSCDAVQGSDGSPYSNTSSKEPYKLQGIEQSYGCYEVTGDTILQYSNNGTNNVLTCHVCRDATKIATSVTADYRAAGYSVVCPAASGWQYIKRLGWDINLPECWFAKEIDGSSSTYTRDGLYILAASSGQYEWLALGRLYIGLASTGLSCAGADSALSGAAWYVGGRLSANGSRGEFAA